MQLGQYITDRWMEQLLVQICKEQAIDLLSYSQNWIYELKKGNKVSRVFGYKFSLNDSVSSLIASDKVATYELLNACHIPAVEHRLIRTKASHSDAWSEGLDRIVVKPLDGTSGHGVMLCRDVNAVLEYIESKDSILAWAASPFEQISAERRLIILDGQVLHQYEKKPILRDGLAMYNLGLGAEAIEVLDRIETTDLALKSLDAVGLRLAAVDLVRIENEWKVLEINDGIMMENYMRQSKENRLRAKHVYEDIIRTMMS